MPLPTTTQVQPFDDAISAADGMVDVTIHIHLNGQLSQVQADWATLAATSLTCPSALMSWTG